MNKYCLSLSFIALIVSFETQIFSAHTGTGLAKVNDADGGTFVTRTQSGQGRVDAMFKDFDEEIASATIEQQKKDDLATKLLERLKAMEDEQKLAHQVTQATGFESHIPDTSYKPLPERRFHSRPNSPVSPKHSSAATSDQPFSLNQRHTNSPLLWRKKNSKSPDPAQSSTPPTSPTSPTAKKTHFDPFAQETSLDRNSYALSKTANVVSLQDDFFNNKEMQKIFHDPATAAQQTAEFVNNPDFLKLIDFCLRSQNNAFIYSVANDNNLIFNPDALSELLPKIDKNKYQASAAIDNFKLIIKSTINNIDLQGSLLKTRFEKLLKTIESL